MCGIAGILHPNQQPASEAVLRKMIGCMAHRGPDADGVHVDHEVALGHRRLSIIDLSTSSNQPFFDNTGRYAIIFNGEIYNFKEVKKMLPDYPFRTQGDTEVLIAAFAKWGAESVRLFKGMFAFAIWDKDERALTIMRDRLGVKPVYYYVNDDVFLFASELRSILSTGFVQRKISNQGLKEYFSYQSIGFPLTAIDGILQMQAGSYIRVKNGKIEKKVYWQLESNPVDFDFSDSDKVQKHIRRLLSASVERRLVSDVPIGAFLSGGIDSSVVVGLMAEVSSQKPNTFTVAFDEKEFDESGYAEVIAKKFNTNHTNIHLKPTVFLEELENGLNAMDTPSGDGINTYVVSKAIRNAGMTVALSGVGGDELFAGYPIFKQFLQLNKQKFIWTASGLARKSVATALLLNRSNKTYRLRQLLNANTPSIENVYPVFRQILAPELIGRLTNLNGNGHFSTALSEELQLHKSRLHAMPLLSQVSAAEYMGYTQHTLLKDMDQMSMAVSLELREPFFDHDLLEFVLAVPDDLKFPVYPKSLLVESVKPLLPDEIVHRKKQGFVFPWNLWMKKELRDFCDQRIRNLSQRSFINKNELLKYWKRFLENDTAVRWTELWIFIVLEYWMERNHVQE